MRPRHRTPTIFNLSMVDMLCCSLGCVILLWLIKADKLQQMQARSSSAQQLLAQTHDDLEKARRKLDSLQEEAATLRVKLDESGTLAADAKERLLSAEQMMQLLAQLFDDARSDADARKVKLAQLENVLLALREQKKDLESRLELSSVNYDDLKKKLSAADLRLKQMAPLADQVPDLKEELKKSREQARSQEALADAMKAQLDKSGRDLAMAEKKLAGLEGQKTSLERSLSSALAYRDQAALSDEKLRKLQKEYDDRLQELTRTQRDLSTMEKERATFLKDNSGILKERETLRREVDRLQREADSRFAGVSLVGSRIVFLVDMSGSMDYVDDDTRSPTKWKGVCETVAKVLKSLPRQPEKIQVIAFSDKVTYPLGNEGKWVDYHPATTADQAQAALRSIKPKGGTNMYAGFEAAFRYRDLGMDAIYFLSDGLPNQGQPLTEDQTRRLSDQEKTAMLGKHVLKTLRTEWNRPIQGRPAVVINSIGFFFESPDVGAFLWALSRENHGSFVGMSDP
jgi:hypothetical protein